MSKIYEALKQASRQKQGCLPLPQQALQHPPHAPSIGPEECHMEEEMLCLYKAVETALPDASKKILQFISARKGEGTSTLIRELAQLTATKIGKSVLLLDADRHTPTQHHYFNIHYDRGWQEAVNDDTLITSVLHKAQNMDLYIGPSSNSRAATPSIFDAHTLNGFWRSVWERFDLILIDSPPLTVSPDGLAIAPKVSGVVIVVEAEKTPSALVKNLKERIERVGGNVLGIVLNKRRYYIPRFIYERM
ncbi:CpsD/CapB family tyrosine-protein kinase [Desulforhabdus sp. TSK]|uniref:CpsD/CapB family tyrosine-protein kinase n=1 Tax=Desulforhabdus sp. TSK TaxID=2925014 RepID=UPI001FC80903|nr:CpsD/CapB family tyrosine-protein kinase [Desulforhabdus sp. TSK]GKT10548.1 hypothetical protein DSTSK_38530 [Desulforhabdus sp. TSK]